MKIIIRAVSGTSEGTYHILTEGAMHVLGRSGNVDWPLNDDRVSRRHCMIWVRDSNVYVRDLGSRNGTFLDDQPLKSGEPEEAIRWYPGTPLRVGESTFQLVLEEQPDADRLLKMKIKSRGRTRENLVVPVETEPPTETLVFERQSLVPATPVNPSVTAPLDLSQTALEISELPRPASAQPPVTLSSSKKIFRKPSK